MSKNKDKKPKEVKEEIKTPSAEVSENGAEVEAEAGEAKEAIKSKFAELSTAKELKALIEELKDLDPNHHNKLVIDITVNESLRMVDDLIGMLVFIEKALSEKKK